MVVSARYLLSIAAEMWMTLGSASVGRGGTFTDITVNSRQDSTHVAAGTSK